MADLFSFLFFFCYLSAKKSMSAPSFFCELTPSLLAEYTHFIRL